VSEKPLIDKAFLAKLERLAIRWQKSLPGLVGGHVASRYAGAGQEFLDHRHFHYGDDLRSVNWRAYLRFEKLFMKMFQLEPRVPVRLFLDTSLSMATGRGAKFNYARRLSAALCYIGLVRLDTITILPFSDQLGDAMVCSGGRHRFGPAADFLSALRPAGPTRFAEVVRQFTSKHGHRGLAIVISDCLGDEGFDRPLELLTSFGHELFLIQIWDEEDRVPPWKGRLELEDAESGGLLDIEFDAAARQRYTEAFDDYCRSLQRVALSAGGRYAGLATSQPLEEAVFGPLARVGGVQ
jgi:uncharacterized protein (DUF58 family)